MKKEVAIDSKYIEENFSKEIAIYFSIIESIRKEFIPKKLLFMSEDDFKKLNKLEDVQYIYWLELIERLYIVAITTLLRNEKWFDSVLIGIINNNFYSFSSSLRCLLESSADSYFSLKNIPTTICIKFNHIKNALQGDARRNIVNEELENRLIHFSHAQKLSSSERKKYPSEFSAKLVIEYLDCIKHENEDVLNLYSILCQVSHPSSVSLLPYLMEEDGGLILHDESRDIELINKIINRYKSTIVTTISRPLLLSLISLNLINKLDYNELIICDKELSYLDKIGIMQDFNKLMNKT